MLNPRQYKLMGHLCLIILDCAEESKDLKSIMKIFDISNKLVLCENNQPLQIAIASHSIWREPLMWEAAIKILSEQELSLNLRFSLNYLEMLDEIKKKEVEVFTNKVLYFAKNMKQLQLSLDKFRQAIANVARNKGMETSVIYQLMTKVDEITTN